MVPRRCVRNHRALAVWEDLVLDSGGLREDNGASPVGDSIETTFSNAPYPAY